MNEKNEQYWSTWSRALKVSNFIRVFQGIVIGSLIDSLLFTIIIYVLFKNIDAVFQRGQKQKQEDKKFQIILLGSLFGSVTGFIFIPILLIFIIKALDQRLEIPKRSPQFQQLNQKYLLTVSQMIIGSFLGFILIFVDLWILKACTLIFVIVIFCYTQIGKIQCSFRLDDRSDPQNRIKNTEQYAEIQYFQNILFSSIFAFYFPTFSTWTIFFYVWYFFGQKIERTIWKNKQQLSTKLKKKQTVNQIQQQMQCLISSQTMAQPSFLKQCGHTFSRASIQQWMTKRASCPACNSATSAWSIKPNVLLDQFMGKWKRFNKSAVILLKSQ